MAGIEADTEPDEVVLPTEGEVTETETEGELSVTIEGASPALGEDDDAADWVKELRRNQRELTRRNRELEEQLKVTQSKPSIELGPKPTLESCNYEEEKFETALTTWHDAKRKQGKAAAEAEAEVAKSKNDWQTMLANHRTASVALKVKNYDAAEDVAKDTLSVVQQGIILQGATNSALVIYALGTNPTKARELASIKDPIKFAFAVAQLETKLKLSPTKPPAPEKVVRTGGASLSNASEKHLDNLRKSAEKTGDYTKVVAYKRQLRASK